MLVTVYTCRIVTAYTSLTTYKLSPKTSLGAHATSNVSSFIFSSSFVTYNQMCRVSVSVVSPEIAKATLRVAIPWQRHIYGYPFLSLYPLLAYAYFFKYNQWLVSEEWTFLACVMLGAGHALSFLSTRWNTGARAWITTREVRIFNWKVCGLMSS